MAAQFRFREGRSLAVLCGLCLVLVGLAHAAHAQSSQLTLTVTPPLIQLTLQPGESWTSGIEVVNSNPYAITVGAEVVPFVPSGENGRVAFLPSDVAATQPTARSLAHWITVPMGKQAIPAGKTVTLPLSIAVPDTADPGGHYAAVIIGNSAGSTDGESALSVTGSIASLVFLRVSGDIIEAGRIRDFVTERTFYDTAEARLSLRFENQGNVHLQPRGDITIYNMFGKKRGYVPINQEGGYGSVLPGSIRAFAYTWSSDTGEWDFGRYRAEATLGYGTEATQYAQGTTYFYVLPIVPLLKAVGAIVTFLLCLWWAVRTYVRHALALEHVEQMGGKERSEGYTTQRVTTATLLMPVRAAVMPPKHTPQHTPPEPSGNSDTTHLFFRTYRIFFGVVLLVAVSWLAASAYFEDVLTYERTYRVVEERDTVSSSTHDQLSTPAHSAVE